MVSHYKDKTLILQWWNQMNIKSTSQRHWSLLFLPVERCVGKTTRHHKFLIHFFNHHVQDTILILEGVTFPHPWCELFDVFVTRKFLNTTYQHTKSCDKGSEAKLWLYVVEYFLRSLVVFLTVNIGDLDSLDVFEYTVRIMSPDDIYCHEVFDNIFKWHEKWVSILRMLVKEGAKVRILGKLYTIMVQ